MSVPRARAGVLERYEFICRAHVCRAFDSHSEAILRVILLHTRDIRYDVPSSGGGGGGHARWRDGQKGRGGRLGSSFVHKMSKDVGIHPCRVHLGVC